MPVSSVRVLPDQSLAYAECARLGSAAINDNTPKKGSKALHFGFRNARQFSPCGLLVHRCHGCPWLRNDRLFSPRSPFFVPCVGRTLLTEKGKKVAVCYFSSFFFPHMQYTNPSAIYCTYLNSILQTGLLIFSCFSVVFIITASNGFINLN